MNSADRQAIDKLAGRGLKAGQIAQRLGKNATTVNYYMVTKGLRAPSARQFAYKRKGSEVKSFSPEEDAFIHALRLQNYTYAQISEYTTKRFGYRRSTATIGTRLRMLASRETAAET